MYRYPWRPDEGTRSPARELQVVVSGFMWVLGTKVGSSGRAVSSLNY